MIARCSDVADVISCVNFARENELLLAVRGGGGFGVADDALVIDLSALNVAFLVVVRVLSEFSLLRRSPDPGSGSK